MRLLFSRKLVGAQRPSSTKGLTVIPFIAWEAVFALIVLMVAIPFTHQIVYRMQKGPKRVVTIIVLVVFWLAYLQLWILMVAQPWFWGFPEDVVLVALAGFGLFSLIASQPTADETTTV